MTRAVWGAGSFFFVGVIAGCAPPPATKVSAPSHTAASASPAPSTKFQEALEAARTARRQAEAISFVRPSSSLPQDERIDALTDWVNRRHPATIAAYQAYAAAREHATSAEQVLVERERGELVWTFLEAKISASLAIFPSIDNAPAERIAMLRGAIATRFKADAQQAREHLLACLMLAGQLGTKNAESARCEELVRAIDALGGPKKERNPALEEWQFARLESKARKRQPVTRAPGCVLGGSAHTTSTELYAAATGSEFGVTLEDFDVATLELPAKSGERARLRITYPFEASGYVDLDGIVETAARIELVPGHVWLPAGSQVRAFGADSSSQVSLEREQGERTEPSLALRTTCSQLTLGRERPVVTEDAKGEASQLSGVVPLFSGPAGKRVAQLDASLAINVRVLGRRSGWVHVTSLDAGASLGKPYEFDAWVAESFAPVGKEAFGIAVLALAGRPPTHEVMVPLPLRLAADPGAPVVALLVPGVRFLAGQEQDGMRRIRFNEAHGNNEGRDFWITREDLAQKAAAVPGVN